MTYQSVNHSYLEIVVAQILLGWQKTVAGAFAPATRELLFLNVRIFDVQHHPLLSRAIGKVN